MRTQNDRLTYSKQGRTVSFFYKKKVFRRQKISYLILKNNCLGNPTKDSNYASSLTMSVAIRSYLGGGPKFWLARCFSNWVGGTPPQEFRRLWIPYQEGIQNLGEGQSSKKGLYQAKRNEYKNFGWEVSDFLSWKTSLVGGKRARKFDFSTTPFDPIPTMALSGCT